MLVAGLQQKIAWIFDVLSTVSYLFHIFYFTINPKILFQQHLKRASSTMEFRIYDIRPWNRTKQKVKLFLFSSTLLDSYLYVWFNLLHNTFNFTNFSVRFWHTFWYWQGYWRGFLFCFHFNTNGIPGTPFSFRWNLKKNPRQYQKVRQNRR